MRRAALVLSTGLLFSTNFKAVLTWKLEAFFFLCIVIARLDLLFKVFIFW